VGPWSLHHSRSFKVTDLGTSQKPVILTEEQCFQWLLEAALFTVVSQFVWKWVPDNWSGDRKSTTAECTALMTWHNQLVTMCWSQWIIYFSTKFCYIFLWQLKRAAVPCEDMLLFYIAVIRPVMECAAPVWHTGLTAELAESIKSIQKRALRIIFGGNSFTISSYHSFCDSLAISSLHDRIDLSIDFFRKIFHPSSCLHHLPDKRHNSQIHKLRNHSLYPPPFARAQKFKNSFMVHSVRHYQQNL